MANEQSYDVNLVKAAAAGRWTEILSALSAIDQELLDGRHHPCPRCGGSDRFRSFNDSTGGAICNQCLPNKGGDGLAVLQWMNGWDFQKSLEEVAVYCNVSPANHSTKPKPDDHIKWLDWSDELASIWCSKKKPITPAAIKAIGGRIGQYNKTGIIGIPHYGLSKKIVGWTIYNLYGRMLPKYSKDGTVIDMLKVKITYGSKPGIIGTIDRLGTGGECWKCEGPPDVLSLLSVNPDLCVVTNSNGAGQRPGEMAKRFEGHSIVHMVHDCDRAGQEGAGTWAVAIQKYVPQVRNIILPYDMEEAHGKDLRDYLCEGNGFNDLSALALKAKPINPKEIEIEEEVDDPHKLARANLERYNDVAGGTLKFWRDRWYRWKRSHYVETENSVIKTHMTSTIRSEFEKDYYERIGTNDEGPIQKVTVNLVNESINALKTLAFVPWSTRIESLIGSPGKHTWISMKNGIVDFDMLMSRGDEFRLKPHDPNWFSVLHRPYNFNTEATCDIWENFIMTSMEDDIERVNLLQEWCGYCLIMDTTRQKFLLMEGEGGNGKSAFFAGLTAMLGEESVSHVPLEKFGERFELHGTLGKLVNISSDAGELDRKAEGVIKTFTGDGNQMEFDRKGIAKVTANPTAKLAIGVNNRPRWNDKTDGIWRRMILIPWNRSVPASERINGMDRPEFWVENNQVEGMFLWALAGLRRLTMNNQFTDPEICQIELEDYKREANPAREFMEGYEACDDEENVACHEIYEEYKKWCVENSYKPLGNKMFGKQVKRLFPKSDRKRRGYGEDYCWRYTGIMKKSREFI